MRTIKLTALLMVVIAAYSIAQTTNGRSTTPSHPGGVQHYNPKAAQTINGTIVNVDSIVHAGSYPGWVYLIVKTSAETTTVFLGPVPYVNERKMTLKSNDSIQVTGSTITLEGRPVIVAREVKSDNQVLQLRDANGVPLWRGTQKKQ